MAHASELIAADIDEYLDARTSTRACCGSSPAAASTTARARSSAGCSTSRTSCSRTTSPRSRPTRRRSAPRAATSTSPCCSTGSPPSASRASRSTSPTASSPPSAASSSSPTRPGHEQYTRNMVTGASTADVAVILVDARKGVLTQTRRHSFLVSLLGIKRVVVADQQDGPRRLLAEVVRRRSPAEYRDVRRPDRPRRRHVHPAVGAARRQHHRPEPAHALVPRPDAARLPRDRRRSTTTSPTGRSACRCSGSTGPNLDFRGFSGRIVGGTIRPGDPIRVLPSGTTSTVERIVTMDGDLDEAIAGQSVTLTLADEIDASRGDVICAADDPAEVADQFEAHVVWMHEDADAARAGRT